MKRNSPIALVMSLTLCLALTLVPGVEACDDFDEVEASEVVVIDAAAEGECKSEEVLADDVGADKTEASASKSTVVGDAGADETEVAAVEPQVTIVEDEAGVEAEPEAEEKNEDVTLVSNVALTSNAQGHWLVTGEYTGGALQRYWVQADGTFVTSTLITPDMGSSAYYAYAKSDGTVVRGKYTASNGYVYLADNDGRLESTGWLVTKTYDGGLQRYYIDKDAHAAIPGYSTDGWAHLTTTSGYVLRGAGTYGGKKYYANNDGKLKVNAWVVTGDFTSGKLQRYWAGEKGAFVTSTLITPDMGSSAYYAYAKSDGTVVRGKYDTGKGYVYIADNDGRLPTTTGWLVTKAYDGGLQRYYIDADKHAAKTGYFEVDGSSYYGLSSKGYVLRGKLTLGSGMLLADNDGKLATGSGWLVTSAYDGGLQRYYLGSYCTGGLTGARLGSFSVDGSDYFGRYDTGYVVRGSYTYGDTIYYANNDGKITSTASATLVNWTKRIDAYLAGSKLAGYGYAFAEAALTYNIDPRWSPAIAKIESSLGKNCFLPYNAWGWGHVSWSNWEQAIWGHIAGLSSAGYGYTISYAKAQTYCPSNPYGWYVQVSAEMNKI